MKKIRLWAVILAFAMLFPCSCGATEKRPLLELPFSLGLTENSSGTDFSVTVTKSGCSAEIYAPEVLKGAVVKRTADGAATVSLGDLERPAKNGYFPFFDAVSKALSPIGSQGFEPMFENGICRYTIDGMTVLVYYDPTDGLITKIETEEQGKRFVFEAIPAKR